MDTNALAEQFHHEGFIVARQLFTPDEVKRIHAALTAHIAKFAATLGTGDIFYEPDGKTIKSMFRLDRRDAGQQARESDQGRVEVRRLLRGRRRARSRRPGRRR